MKKRRASILEAKLGGRDEPTRCEIFATKIPVITDSQYIPGMSLESKRVISQSLITSCAALASASFFLF